MSSSRFVIAAHIVTLLAYIGEESATSELIAKSVNTNPVVIRRLLGLLSKSGIASSIPGAAGGSRLARSPDRITLRDVYQAVEPGELFALHPQHPNARCPIGAHIQAALKPTFENAEAAMKGAIGLTTIADLAKSVRRNHAAASCSKTSRKT